MDSQTPAYLQLLEITAPYWVSGPARIEGDEVVFLSHAEPFYVSQREMELDRSLLSDLLAVRDGYDVLGFARRWGLLWHGPTATEYREPIADWLRIADELRAILEIDFALRASIGSGKPDAAERLRKVLETRIRIDLNRWPKNLASLDVERRADVVVTCLLNRGLQSTRLGVTSAALIGYPMETANGSTADARGQPGHFYTLTRFDDLIGYAYDTVRRHIVEEIELYRCARCGAVRPRTHGSQKYCSSRCESAAKEERRRQKVAKAASTS